MKDLLRRLGTIKKMSVGKTIVNNDLKIPSTKSGTTIGIIFTLHLHDVKSQNCSSYFTEVTSVTINQL